MTQVKTNAVIEPDTTARGPLSLLLAAAVKWFVVAGVLALIHSIQRHTPSFLQAIPAFTYGRTQAMVETAFIYGWAANSSYAVALWILARLGAGPWRGLGLLTGGCIFWNLGVLAGIVCIAAGEGTMIQYLQMPAYLHPVLLISGAAIATPAILAWTGRRSSETYAAQWYAVAALFLFPWLYSAGQVMLLAAPVSGVAHAIVAAWFAQGVSTLWLAPIGMAAAYYLVPRLTGRPVVHYEYAPHAFWVLIVVGSWTGVRQLVGGPVPVWLSSIGIASASLVLFHHVLVALNLREAFRGGAAAPLTFVRAGLVAYLACGFLTAATSLHGAALTLQFTHFQAALQDLFLGGAFTLLVLGALYELVPRLNGVDWPSAGQVRAHYALAVGGIAISTVALAAAGWVQGRGMLNPEISFGAIAASTRPFLLAATVGQAALLLGGIIFATHYFRLIAAGFCPAGKASAAGSTVSAS